MTNESAAAEVRLCYKLAPVRPTADEATLKATEKTAKEICEVLSDVISQLAKTRQVLVRRFPSMSAQRDFESDAINFFITARFHVANHGPAPGLVRIATPSGILGFEEEPK